MKRAPHRRFLLRALGLLLLIPLMILAGLVLRAAVQPSQQVSAPPIPRTLDADAEARHLADALKLPTIAHPDERFDPMPFHHQRGLLEQRFSRVHAELLLQVFEEHSLLYTWLGTEPSLAPVVLMAHLDVVPADADRWSVPPFSGRIEEGYIWGRGALDNKQNAVGQLAAVEHLLEQGFRPRRTVHLAFGHDEEVGGLGARAIAQDVLSTGQTPFLVLDEGGLIVTDGLDGVERPVALIGVAEKGYVTVELVAHDDGGHASMPPPRTASGRIAAAAARIEAHPFPASLDGVAGEMLTWVAPETRWPMRAVYANARLLSPLLSTQMVKKPGTNALVRTTTAVTMLQGSPAENVLPHEARAAINFRLLPGDTAAQVLDHVRRVVDDPTITVRAAGGIESEASPVSTTRGPAFEALQYTLAEVFPEAVVAPYLMAGATDARWYAHHSPHVYRFTPVLASLEDVGRIHGQDERISVQGYSRLIGFYIRLLERAAGPSTGQTAGGPR